MPFPSRPMPTVGASARIRHFGGSVEHAVVVAVLDDGRRLRVRGDGGRIEEFVLSPATARFTSSRPGAGDRLELLAAG